MTPSCSSCRHHQPALDPEGCFVQASTTGFLGKMWVVVMGCERYEAMLDHDYLSDKILRIK